MIRLQQTRLPGPNFSRRPEPPRPVQKVGPKKQGVSVGCDVAWMVSDVVPHPLAEPYISHRGTALSGFLKSRRGILLNSLLNHITTVSPAPPVVISTICHVAMQVTRPYIIGHKIS